MATDTAELRYYSAREVARLMRLSDGHVLKLIRDGRIRSIRLGQTIRVSADAINSTLGCCCRRQFRARRHTHRTNRTAV